jgi:hypothetical protein
MRRVGLNELIALGFAFFLLLAGPAFAQATGATLSGTVTDPSGKTVSDAKISVKNLLTAESVDTQTDSSGHYSVPNLEAGDYEISISAAGFSTNVSKVNIPSGTTAKSFDVTLGGTLSLGDLGFSQSQTQGSAAAQARLNRRSHMLKIHQTLGLITTGPLLATVIAGGFAGGRSTSSTDRDLHAALGSVTAGLYFTTASFAIFAPKIPGTPTRGQIRWHKALAWIHGPGMVLTPILGAMAFDQKSKGERVHGIASAHGFVAVATAAAYGAAIMSVSIKF